MIDHEDRLRVSFVIPSLNQGRFIRRTLDSCFEQDLDDFEVLVQDGGSTDETIDVLRTYGDRVQWLSEPDHGQSDAINRAIERASGDVIAWINSDDYYAQPGVVRRLLQEFQADSRVDIVYGDGQLVDPEGRVLRPFPSRQIDQRAAILMTKPTTFVLQPALLFRKRIFLAAGGLRNDLALTMDQDLWFKIFPLAEKAVYLPTLVASAVMHEDAKTVYAMSKQVKELAQVKRQHLSKFKLTRFERLQMTIGHPINLLYCFLVKTIGMRFVMKFGSKVSGDEKVSARHAREALESPPV